MVRARQSVTIRILRLAGAPALLAGVFLCGASFRGPAAGAQAEGGTEPAKLRPTAGRRDVEPRLVPGEILLLRFLQSFSDYSGQVVYVDGTIPPAAALELTERLRTLESKTVARVLETHGYDLSTETVRGGRAWWVQKTLHRPSKKGALTPSKERGPTTPDDESKSTPTPAPDRGHDATDEPALCLYRRENGTGATFVVIYESTSRREAEEALSVLQAHRRAAR